MLHGMGIDTGIDLDALVDAGGCISGVLGRPPVSRAGKALLAQARRRRPSAGSVTAERRPEGFQRVARGAGRARPPARAALAATWRRAPRRRPPTRWAWRSGQIAKSVIFRRRSDDAAVLVVTSGDRRVDEKQVAAHRRRRSAAPTPTS